MQIENAVIKKTLPRINFAAITDVFAAVTHCGQATLLVRVLLASPWASSKPISKPFLQFFNHTLTQLRGARIWLTVVRILVKNCKSEKKKHIECHYSKHSFFQKIHGGYYKKT